MTSTQSALVVIPSIDAVVELPVPDSTRKDRRRASALAKARRAVRRLHPKTHQQLARQGLSLPPLRARERLRLGAFDDRDRALPGGVRVTTPRLLSPRRRFPLGTVTPAGLLALTQTAVAAYTETTGHSMPWNLAWKCGSCVSRYRGQIKDEGQLERVARITGWLRAAAIGPFPVLRRLIAKTTSFLGVNSPRTKMNVWDFASHTRSPGAAEALLRKVQRRADQLLSPYGVSVSWAGLATALQSGDKRVGKAARKAARETLRGLLERRFRLFLHPATGSGLCTLDVSHRHSDQRTEWVAARVDPLLVARGLKAALAADPRIQRWAGGRIAAGEFTDLRSALAASARLKLDTTDGVEMVADPTQAESIGGCRVLPGYRTEKGMRGGALRTETDRCYMVVGPAGRTYHSRGNWLSDGPKGLVREALDAWRRQDELARIDTELVGNDRYSVLVRLEHSAAAGNCQPGTLAWMRRHGFSGRRIVPARDLVKLVGTDPRVRNVLIVAAREAADQAQASA